MDSIIPSTLISCPLGGSDGEFNIDLEEVFRLEVRKQEVAAVTKMKAPELMQAFESGYSSCAQILPRIAYELATIKDEINNRRAVVLLEEAPRILKEKGMVTARNPAGSADMRESVLDKDEEYRRLKDRMEQITAIYEFIKNKMRGFEMSFSAVKKVYDSLSQYGQLNDRKFSGGINDDEVSHENNISSIGIPKF